MPGYRKRYKRKRRPYKGLQKVKRDIKWLKNNIEFKHLTTIDEITEANTSGLFTLINGITQGTLPNNRIGDEVTARRIRVRGTCVLGPTETDCTVRIMVVRRKAHLGQTLPTTGLFLESGSVTGDMLLKAHDWKVYADHTFTMDTQVYSRVPFKFDFKLDHKVRYDGITNDVSDIQANALFMWVASTNITGNTAPDVTYTSRFYYCDS